MKISWNHNDWCRWCCHGFAANWTKPNVLTVHIQGVGSAYTHIIYLILLPFSLIMYMSGGYFWMLVTSILSAEIFPMGTSSRRDLILTFMLKSFIVLDVLFCLWIVEQHFSLLWIVSSNFISLSRKPQRNPNIATHKNTNIVSDIAPNIQTYNI